MASRCGHKPTQTKTKMTQFRYGDIWSTSSIRYIEGLNNMRYQSYRYIVPPLVHTWHFFHSLTYWRFPVFNKWNIPVIIKKTTFQFSKCWETFLQQIMVYTFKTNSTLPTWTGSHSQALTSRYVLLGRNSVENASTPKVTNHITWLKSDNVVLLS